MTHWRVSDTSANELFKRRVAAASQRILAQDMMDAETERLERREQVDHFVLGSVPDVTIAVYHALAVLFHSARKGLVGFGRWCAPVGHVATT